MQRVVGPDGRLPDGVETRWFGDPRPPALDYLVRRLASEVTREPAHVGYVSRPSLVAALRAEAPLADLVYLFGWGTAQLAAHTGGTPAVHHAIDPWAVSFANRRLPAWRRAADVGQRALAARHEARHYPGCARVVVVAAADAELLARQVPTGRYAVVPNGVEVGPEPSSAPAEPVLGFHGAFETQANVDGARELVEQVLPRVRAVHPAARVLLVGRDPPAQVRALAERPGVLLRANVPAVRPELERMSVYVALMPRGFGLKNKVLEAMAAARPVVANGRGLSGIGQGAGVWRADDAAAAAAVVNRLLSDPAQLARSGRSGRARVATNFSWAASARGLERVWQEAVP